MHRILTLTAVCFVGTVGAQSLTLASDVTSAARNYAEAAYLTQQQRVSLSQGPAMFPLQAQAQVSLFATADLRIEQPAGAPAATLVIIGDGVAVGSAGRAYCVGELSTRVSMPLPARVPVAVSYAIRWPGLGFYNNWHQAFVDVGADGTQEYSFAGGAATPPGAQLDVLVDSRGTPILWQSTVAISGPAGSNGGATLQLQLTEPLQDPAYGPTCRGELGSQPDPVIPFRRVLVASFPGDSVLGWIAGGTRQTSVSFPGFPCPLLNNALVIAALPLRDGPNGRKMGALEVDLPPLPGALWFAQGIAAVPGSIVGTNGVRIQT